MPFQNITALGGSLGLRIPEAWLGIRAKSPGPKAQKRGGTAAALARDAWGADVVRVPDPHPRVLREDPYEPSRVKRHLSTE